MDRATPNRGRLAHVREVVARSAMGAVGALGVGAAEMDLVDVQRTGLPRGVVTVDGSRVVTKDEWLIGAHRDIYHDEIATLVLLAAGSLTGGPAGLRPRRALTQRRLLTRRNLMPDTLTAETRRSSCTRTRR